MFLYIIREEEQLENDEYDNQFYQDDDPQRAPQRHTLEAVEVEVPYVA